MLLLRLVCAAIASCIRAVQIADMLFVLVSKFIFAAIASFTAFDTCSANRPYFFFGYLQCARLASTQRTRAPQQPVSTAPSTPFLQKKAAISPSATATKGTRARMAETVFRVTPPTLLNPRGVQRLASIAPRMFARLDSLGPCATSQQMASASAAQMPPISLCIRATVHHISRKTATGRVTRPVATEPHRGMAPSAPCVGARECASRTIRRVNSVTPTARMVFTRKIAAASRALLS